MNFESTVTEADFKRPLLDTQELRMIREVHREPDLTVDNLSSSLFGWFARLFVRNPR